MHEANAYCWVTLTFLSSGIGLAIMLVIALVIALAIALVLLCNCVEIREQTLVWIDAVLEANAMWVTLTTLNLGIGLAKPTCP